MPTRFKPILMGWLALYLSGLPLAQAADLPDLGDSARSVLSSQDEEQLGGKIMRSIREAGPVVDDPDISDYLNRLGGQLAAAQKDTPIPFDFFAIDDPAINAFALPGGHIGIHTGLIVTSQTESELASVLAHEMAHVSQRHIARMAEKQGHQQWLALGGILAAVLAGKASGNGQVAAAAASIGPGVAIQNQLAYSRDFEREADRAGMDILAGAGFSPSGMADFFQRLQQSTRLDNNQALAFLRTHPVTLERISDSQNLAAKRPFKMRADSLDYSLIREKTRVRVLGAEPAIKFYQEALASRRFSHEGSQWYGLAVAYLAAREPQKAQQAWQRADALGLSHPVLVDVAARIRLAQKDFQGAKAIYRQGLQRFPSARSLIYGEIDTVLAADSRETALATLRAALNKSPQDAALWSRQARLYADRDPLRYHFALGNAAFYQGRLSPALEQYQFAARAPGEDFYLRSSLEARMRDIQERLRDEPKNRQ